jgi:hypothetical protein
MGAISAAYVLTAENPVKTGRDSKSVRIKKIIFAGFITDASECDFADESANILRTGFFSPNNIKRPPIVSMYHLRCLKRIKYCGA